MKNASNRYLDQLAQKSRDDGGTGSDYRLAQLLDVPKGTISNYRRGISQMDDAVALRLADLLGVPPLAVIAQIHLERAKDSRLRSMWQQASKLARRSSAAVVIASAGIGGGALPAHSDTAPAGSGGVYILCQTKTRRPRAPMVATIIEHFAQLYRNFHAPLQPSSNGAAPAFA